jgi:hypothetical protein
MEDEIYKSKIWQSGIIIVLVAILLSVLLPLIFTSFELIAGILLVIIGIIMIYQIFKPDTINNKT